MVTKIERGAIMKEIPVPIMKMGKNGGFHKGIAGHIRFRELVGKGYETERRLTEGQIFHLPKYRNLVGISKSIFKDWIFKYECDYIKIRFTGDRGDSFFVFFKPKEFYEKGIIVRWEDEQILCNWAEKPRIQSEQEWVRGINAI